MAKMKQIYIRSFSASKSLFWYNPNIALKWKVKDPQGWVNMSREERINYALEESDPSQPEIAYYKGVGLSSISHMMHSKAIAAFNLALQLTEGKFWSASVELSKIYAKEKNYDMAYRVLVDAVQTLNESIKSDGYSLEDIKSLMQYNLTQPKYHKKSLPHGLTNDHFEELAWLGCWHTSFYLAKIGDLKGAYTTLLLGKDHLESAISNNKLDFEYLKNLLLTREETPISVVGSHI